MNNGQPGRAEDGAARESTTDDLFWIAFQYATDELAPAEAERFEQRLSLEQPAREALAAVVAMLDAGRIVEAGRVAQAGAAEMRPAAMAVVPAAQERRMWQTSAAWFALGAAACLAIIFVASRGTTPPGVGPTAAARPTQAQRDLALAWFESQNLADDHATDDHETDADAIHAPTFDGQSATLAVAGAQHEPAAPHGAFGDPVVLSEAVTDDMLDAESPLPIEEPTAPEWLIAALAETRSPRVVPEN